MLGNLTAVMDVIQPERKSSRATHPPVVGYAWLQSFRLGEAVSEGAGVWEMSLHTCCFRMLIHLSCLIELAFFSQSAKALWCPLCVALDLQLEAVQNSSTGVPWGNSSIVGGRAPGQNVGSTEDRKSLKSLASEARSSKHPGAQWQEWGGGGLKLK